MMNNKNVFGLVFVVFFLASCSSFLPRSGPSATAVHQQAKQSADVQLVDLTPLVAARIHQGTFKKSFSNVFHSAAKKNWGVQPGDVLEVYIWESAPQLLFGSNSIPGITSAVATTKNTALPEQVVDENGCIRIPYAGTIFVAGKTLSQIENKIINALRGKANYPQVIVRMVQNVAANVTVVGEVTNSVLVPLTPKRERVLDAIAAAGGVKAPINKVTIQMTRKGKSQSMALQKIIQDPKQNLHLEPSDVLTAYYQELSFTVLGASGKNTEINFESQGISLAQALGRMGGVNDNTANASALFIFRFEDRENIKLPLKSPQPKIPVVYRVNLAEPSTFFVAQRFYIQDKDVIYISNSPGTELAKFLRIVGSALYPVALTNVI